MDWETFGGFCVALSVLITLVVEWRRLRRIGLQQLLASVFVGIVVLISILALSQVPALTRLVLETWTRRQPSITTRPESLATPTHAPTSEGVSPVRFVEAQKTGPEQRRVYNVTLAADEVIVGDAYDFQDQDYTCVVFMIQGRGSRQFAVVDGAWYRYSGVTSQDQADELLQARVDYLRGHWFCKHVDFPVIRQ